ncbi:MAG: hypothetical protein P4L46_07665 [Fimbriimonas sp.]|nr:hypothetical protein [Fimbriimonas sp.]
MVRSRTKAVLGIFGVIVATTIAGFWSVWGTIENFHEGWYTHSLWSNLLLAAVQYVGWPLGFAFLSCIAIWRPAIGSALFALIGVGLNAFLFGFRNGPGIVLILVPCLMLAVLFGVGRTPKPRVAAEILLGVPMVIMVVIGTPLLWKVSHRLTAISSGALTWKAPSETMVWAPPGPGWTTSGSSFAEAESICDRLAADGKSIVAKPTYLWRLPTAEEAIHALNRGGVPAGCRLGRTPGFQPCFNEPDKEAPLWNPYCPIIYWWTASHDQSGKVLRVAYNGYVLPVDPCANGYTGFRAVRVDTYPEAARSLFR